jgi:hypothetical protein
LEAAVSKCLDDGIRTADIHQDGMQLVGTAAMGDAVIDRLNQLN